MQTRETVHIEPYSCYLTVIFTDKSVKNSVNAIYKKHKEPHRLKTEASGVAISIGDGYSYYIVYQQYGNKLGIDTFSHEIDHIKNSILQERDVAYSRDSDEVGAYLVGYISKLVYKIMQKKNINFLN